MIKKLGFAVFLSAFIAGGFIQNVHAAGIASVDARYVVSESEEMKRVLAEVETMKTAMEKELGEKEKELESLSESLKRKRTILSQEQLMEEESSLKARLREYRTKGENMNEKLSNEVTIGRKKVIKALEDVVVTVAKEKDLEVILDSSSLLYAAEGTDMTEEVLGRLNDYFNNN
mgnify:CR=1 FL=1